MKRRQVAAEDREETLRKICEVLAAELGTSDPDLLAAGILEVLAPVPHEGTVEMVKALAGMPMGRLGMPGALEAAFADRADHFERLAKATPGSVPAEHVRERRSEADVIADIKALKPTPIGHAAGPYEDRRPLLREELAHAQAEGLHPTVITQMQNDLAFEHVRAATARPSATATAAGITVQGG